ncbi:MAG: hypothetical protein KUF75_07835 [Candidatus Thiodiazotropha sp. (ex Ctena orbiculata)]|nr:hypothetical protein [Candidatus Thiodiazotropha taylori]
MAETKIPHPNIKKLHLVKRERSPFYYARFFHKGKRYQISTECDNMPDACAKAESWYLDQQALIRGAELKGELPPPSAKAKKKSEHTIAKASITALADMRASVKRGEAGQQGEASPEYYRGVRMVMNAHILTYWQDFDCKDVTLNAWKKYKRDIQVIREEEGKKPLSKATFHQIKNALRACLRVAEENEWIDTVPNFREVGGSKQRGVGRAWFEEHEQKILCAALKDNIQDLEKTRHHKSAMELHDYVEFMLYSGLRVSEQKNVRFRDIEIHDETLAPGQPSASQRQILWVKNISGKRGLFYGAPTQPEAVTVFRRILKRRGVKNWENCDELLFIEHHRTGFNAVLNRLNMKFDSRGRKRDFVSLRHSYIINRILDGIDDYVIAEFCRTSADIIREHYADSMDKKLLAGRILKKNRAPDISPTANKNTLF